MKGKNYLNKFKKYVKFNNKVTDDIKLTKTKLIRKNLFKSYEYIIILIIFKF